MKACDVMSHPVVTVRPHLPVHAAAARLAARGYTAAPVVTAEGVVLGIVTEADLLRGQVMTDEVPTDPALDPPVSAVMTSGPIVVGPGADMAEVAALMLDHGIRSVPVLDHGHLIGIITRRDLLHRVAGRELIRDRSGAAV